jgi:hypothetical protein
MAPCYTSQSTMCEEQVYIRGSIRNRKTESPDDIRVWVSRRIQASGFCLTWDNYGTSASHPLNEGMLNEMINSKEDDIRKGNVISSTAIDAKPGNNLRNGGESGRINPDSQYWNPISQHLRMTRPAFSNPILFITNLKSCHG